MSVQTQYLELTFEATDIMVDSQVSTCVQKFRVYILFVQMLNIFQVDIYYGLTLLARAIAYQKVRSEPEIKNVPTNIQYLQLYNNR